MSNRTRGKWVVSSSTGVCNKEGVIVADGMSLMALPEEIRPTTYEELEANAALIAAAPEMLEALKSLVSMAEMIPNERHTTHPIIVEAYRVINKAENN